MENFRNDELIGKEFKNIASAKNYILNTNIYTSKMGESNYVGRNKAEGMGGGGFKDPDGVHNIFLTEGRTDANWKNTFYDKINLWLEICVDPDKEKCKEWAHNRYNEKVFIRIFLKEEGSKNYKCKGVYKQMDMKIESSTVAWKRC